MKSRNTVALYIAVLVVAAATNICKTQDITQRIANITSRPYWRHPYLVPNWILAKAETMTGDDSRMKAFMTKLIKGQEQACGSMEWA